MLVDVNVPLLDDAGYGDALAETAHSLGVRRLCIAGGEQRYGLADNAAVQEAAEAYPDLLLPFARIALDEDTPATVERHVRSGFVGFCAWGPRQPYDAPTYMPLYEAADALHVPLLLHTGCLPPTPMDRADTPCADNMRPIRLDTLARRFPGLTIIGTGLGSPWCEEAVEAMRLHRNVYFDLSGGILRRRAPEYFGRLFAQATPTPWADDSRPSPLRQLVFGSGARHEEIASAERDYQRILRSLGADREDVDAVMGGTQSQLLGLDAQT